MALFSSVPVVVRGGGDLASGVIFRLRRAGFPVTVLELASPLLVRRTVCFGDAVYEGKRTVEGITARLAHDLAEAQAVTQRGDVPVLIDPDGVTLSALQPVVLIDARMEKRNLGTTIHDAPLVIGLGPGFTAGVDCHAVVETNRGHDLGRVIESGSAEADTGEPGAVLNRTQSRVLRAPTAGFVQPTRVIGDLIGEGEEIARIDGVSISAPFTGMLRGLIHARVHVWAGLKIGDLDPRADRRHCFTLSDKSLAVGGGVLEAVLASAAVRASLQ